MRFGSLLQNALDPTRRPSHVGPISPPGIPPANPLGLTPPAALAEQQTPAEAMPTQWMPQDAPPKPAPGISNGQLIMGILADALAGAQGKQGMFAQQMGQQRAQEAEAANEQAKWHRDRTAGLEDYEAKQKIEQRYRPPPAPSEFERMLLGAGIQPGTPQAQAAYQGALQGRTDPIVNVDINRDGVLDWVPRSQMSGAGTGVLPTLTTADLDRIDAEGGAGPAAVPGGFPSDFFYDPAAINAWNAR